MKNKFLLFPPKKKGPKQASCGTKPGVTYVVNKKKERESGKIWRFGKKRCTIKKNAFILRCMSVVSRIEQ